MSREKPYPQTPDFKVCPDCGEHRPWYEFNANRRQKDGLQSYCRIHQRIRNGPYLKAYKERNKSKVAAWNRAACRNRRARIKGSEGRFTDRDWRLLLMLGGRKCAKCGATENLTHDHVEPLSLGGEHTIFNSQILCMDCNRDKWATTIDYRPIPIWRLSPVKNHGPDPRHAV